jgi:hypothetical protein
MNDILPPYSLHAELMGKFNEAPEPRRNLIGGKLQVNPAVSVVKCSN